MGQAHEVMMQCAPTTLASANSGSEFTQLIARIRNGDERALESLLAAVAVPLRRMADRLIGSSLRPHLDAEDLVQAVSLTLWHGLRQGKFDFDVPRQLIKLASVLLRRQAARAVKRFRNAMNSTVETNLNATLADRPLRTTQAAAHQAERNDQIRHLMMRVGREDRKLLQLLLLGHSIAASARLLKMEPAALRMRLSRLRVKLRKSSEATPVPNE